MRAITSCLFELRCSIRLESICVACIACFMMGICAYSDLTTYQATLGGSLEGSSALDIFYLALNNPICTGLLLPLACMACCGDTFSRDSHEMTELLLIRSGSHSTYVCGKILSILIVCILCVAISCIALTAYDIAVYHTALSPKIPIWLSYSGSTDDYLLPDGLYSYSLMPERWNYIVTTIALVGVSGILNASVCLAFSALCAPVRVRFLPIIMACFVLITLTYLPSVVVKITYLLSPEGPTAAMPVSDKGLILDRLCLSSYALGASPFQTRVGGPALAAQFLELHPDAAGSLSFELAQEGYTVVSTFETGAWIIVILLASCTRLFFATDVRGHRKKKATVAQKRHANTSKSRDAS